MTRGKQSERKQRNTSARNQCQARENSCDQDVVSTDLESDWLSIWRKNFKPITERSKFISKTKAIVDYFQHSIENRYEKVLRN